MGVYIKGMEMPTDRSRWVVIYPDGKVEYSDKTDEWETLDKGAVPVPQHARIGDLDELKERVTKRLYASNHGSMAEAYFAALIDLIDTAPTIIPAEEGD